MDVFLTPSVSSQDLLPSKLHVPQTILPPRQPEWRWPGGGPSILPAAQPKLQCILSPPPHLRSNLRQVPSASPNKCPIGPSSHPYCCTLAQATTAPPDHLTASEQGGPSYLPGSILPRCQQSCPNPWLPRAPISASLSTSKLTIHLCLLLSPAPPQHLSTLLPQGLCTCCPLCLEHYSRNQIQISSFLNRPFSARHSQDPFSAYFLFLAPTTTSPPYLTCLSPLWSILPNSRKLLHCGRPVPGVYGAQLRSSVHCQSDGA